MVAGSGFKTSPRTQTLCWATDLNPRKGEVIAFAVGMIQSNKPLLLPQRIGYIGMFIVHSKLRRRGIGSSLYKRLLDWFVSNQIKEIQLATEVNNDLAKVFWNDHGFITTYEQKTLK